jgi:hypothetical protein
LWGIEKFPGEIKKMKQKVKKAEKQTIVKNTGLVNEQIEFETLENGTVLKIHTDISECSYIFSKEIDILENLGHELICIKNGYALFDVSHDLEDF